MKQGSLFAILLLTGLFAFSQRPPAISSPDINADGSITFRYFSRSARQVTLKGEFLQSPVSLTGDTSGIWTVTVPPVVPDIYPYSFVVDSVELADPNNTYIFANERFKRSLLEVPGKQPLIHSLQNVPHGRIEYRYYESATLGSTRPLLVYTPPGYGKQPGKKYPVLYLIHGGSDTEETWTRVGKANLIADNLIAAGKCPEMIIVMPYGNVRPKPMPDFTRDVIEDLIPFVEKNYAVNTEAASRAIAGFSVGGGQTLNIGLTHTDRFAYIFSYAPYTETEEFKRLFTNWTPDAQKMNKQLRLFTISVGTEDFLYESVKKNIAFFEEKKIRLTSHIVPGGHTWMNCKKFLATTLEEVFK